jgi:hypothetical protein
LDLEGKSRYINGQINGNHGQQVDDFYISHMIYELPTALTVGFQSLGLGVVRHFCWP